MAMFGIKLTGNALAGKSAHAKQINSEIHDAGHAMREKGHRFDVSICRFTSFLYMRRGVCSRCCCSVWSCDSCDTPRQRNRTASQRLTQAATKLGAAVSESVRLSQLLMPVLQGCVWSR